MQGGWTRVVFAGSGADPTDVVSIPGFNLGTLVPTDAGLYAIVPASEKLAVETDVAASQFSFGVSISVLHLGVRGNYALTPRVYGAAGATLTYINGVANETQLGLQAALGYRHPLSGRLNGRVEVRTTFAAKADNAPPMDTYSVLLGVSTATGRSRTTRNASTAASRRQWTAQLGIAGGYANVHLIGTGSVTVLAFPGYGGAFGNTFGGIVPGFGAVTVPPTMFAIIPITDRVAIEPGLDMQRIQGSGQTSFSGNLSARLDYAVHGGWYGAVGGNLQYLKATGADAATRTGLNLGWGYRFLLTSALGSRVELNYTMFRRNTDLGFDPTNVLGLMFGVTMPLK
ncbi:MAG TPA: hypothetical protein VGJ80_02025 [Gemmatimonadales bacterium]|jgi:hypothetical protein